MSRPVHPIPRPIGHRWRDFRLRYVPLLAYGVGIVVVAWLWRTQWTPSTFSGEVQATVANVASPQDGQLASLSVRQYDRVSKGDVLGHVTLSPAALSASFSAIQAELMVLRVRMAVDGQRNQLSYERVRTDQLNQRVDLMIARSRLHYAEREADRQEALYERKIASQFEYEQALDARDTLAAEVRERESVIRDMDQALAAVEPGSTNDASTLALDAVDASIRAEEDRFRFASESLLTAPIDGVVTRVYRLAGENVFSGEPLFEISSDRAENIIGFIREPGSVAPRVGDTVLVRSRRGINRPVEAEASIVAVGARMELFTRPLRVRGFDNSQERGLPVLIEVPTELTLYPGELVDLAFE